MLNTNAQGQGGRRIVEEAVQFRKVLRSAWTTFGFDRAFGEQPVGEDSVSELGT